MLDKKVGQNVIKVGVLLPQSKEYPKARINFLNGIKLYFTLFENHFRRGKVELIVEDIGYGSATIVNEKAHKLLIQDRVVLIAGYMESSIALDLATMLEQVEVPLLISNLGESAIRPDLIPNNLYYNTFQFWQSYYLLGQYLAERITDNWILISSFYDTGYDPLRSFRAGLRSRNVSPVNEIYLHSINKQDLIDEFEKHIKNTVGLMPALFFPPLLLNQFVDELSSRFKEMVINPFYTHSNQVSKYWAYPNGCLKPEDSSLVNGVKEYLNSSADLFHVLGYRAGALLYEAAQGLENPENDKENIIKIWSEFELDFGGYNLKMSETGRDVSAEIGIFRGNSCTDQFEVCDIRHIEDIPLESIRDLTMAKTAFTNPYMFY